MADNPYGLTDTEMQQISVAAASAEQVNPNFVAGMLSGDAQAANVGSQLQAQQTRGRQQRAQGLQSALQARATARDTTSRQTTLNAAKVKARQEAAALVRQQAQEDYKRDRADELADMEFKKAQALELAELRNLRVVSQTDKEKARLARQERAMRYEHSKTQQPKDLGPTLTKSLYDQSKGVQHLSGALSTFKDEYAADLGIIGRAQNLLSSEAGISTSQAIDDQAAWWRNYKRFIELVERHEFFGATLTKGENISWKQAEIQAGMKPKEIRDNLKERRDLMTKLFKQFAKGVSRSKKNPKAVADLAGGIISVEELPDGVEPFPEDILGAEAAAAGETALEDMSEEELMEALEALEPSGG